MTVDEIIKTKQFADFYSSALSYCDFIEKNINESAVEFLQQTRTLLIGIYDTALKLEEVNLKSNLDFDHNLHDKDIKPLLSSISNRLGTNQFYFHVFDPANPNDNEVVCGDLADDLGDIYKDLKNSIKQYSLDTIENKENALWQFKFDFEKHWSNHCINALNAIHFFLQKY